MSTNGILDFQNTNKVIFRGTDSNVVVDTSNASIGIGIQGTEKPGSNLHVIGDASISSNLKLTTDTSIIVNSNVVTDFNGPHAREPKEVPLKKYPEIAFEEGKFDANESTNTYVQAGYTVSASGKSPSASWAYVWGIFDETEGDEASRSSWIDSNNTTYAKESADAYGGLVGNVLSTVHNTNTLKLASNTPVGAWFTIELPNSIKLDHIQMRPGRWGTDLSSINSFPREFGIWGYEGNAWTLIKTVTEHIATNNTSYLKTIINSNTPYKKIGFVITRINAQGSSNSNDRQFTAIGALKLYGYEEDPPAGDISVDTTFKSILNTPQTTRANVYVDAKLSSDFTNQVTGPTPVGPTVTHDNTNKYWEMNGQLTSNITVEANTFLEGDQPHAVSVWFNSSNLEANVSNTCVFSIASEEKLDSVNLDLQSNTWHNLTYAYQGEGGSRVTYLDGRKVAEDQAEDTFGDYPPFAMTGYSQGGYVVSQGGTNYSGLEPWELFNKSYTNSLESWAARTSDGTLNYTVVEGSYKRYNTSLGTATRLSSDTEYGEYVKLELPYKIRLNYIVIHPHPGSDDYADKFPAFSNVYGSNDDVKWTEITNWTPNDFTLPVNDSDEKTFIANATKSYKYLALVVTGIRGTNHNETVFNGLEYHGHRENDLVRLPDPTNVLKYPHIPLTNYPDTGGPARRGYVATSSGAPNPIYEAQHAFNGVTESGNGSWHSASYYQTTGDRLATRTPTSSLSSWTANGGSTTGELTTHTGEWVKIQLPHKIVLSSIILRQRTSYPLQKVRLFSIVGSNDDTNWFLVHQELTRSGTSSTLQEPDPNTMTGSYSSVAFKYFAIVIHAGVTDNIYDHVSIGDWELYGTEEANPVPIQIGGGNIDKVANFRVYDKFVGEDQALEIWNAQKEEFGRAKPQMVLQQGKLGIGTDAPQGSLSVADEPVELEEFPPRGMTSSETYIEGHGVFKASVSEYTGQGAHHDGWNVFAHGAAEIWLVGNNAGYNLSSGEYEDNEFRLSSETSMGQWIKLEMPYLTNVTKFILQPRGPGAEYQAPKSGELWGSKDNYTWTKLHTFTDIQYYPGHTTFNFENSEFYKYYGLVVTKVGGGDASNDYLGMIDLRYFGTREHRQSVLQDGQLTLTKSLNVPRIGPDLDADDTPRRDRLVVEYNTSTNPTFDGAVRDTSGRGNHGVIYGQTHFSEKIYDATEKTLTFGQRDPPDDRIGTGSVLDGIKLQNTNTVSVWVKCNNPTSWEAICIIGEDTSRKHLGLWVRDATSVAVHSDNALSGNNGGNYEYEVGDMKQWNHITVVRYGTSFEDHHVYVNGAKVSASASTGNTDGGFDLNKKTHLTLGTSARGLYGSATAQNYYLDGSLSNFKLYDTVLTAEEVKTLYDMGRCDEGHHVVNFSKTRVGIGLGDGEAPRGALDVRGDIYGGMPVFFDVRFTSAPTATHAGSRIVWDTINDSRGGGFDTSSGTFTAPIGGVYKFSYWARGNISGQGIKIKPRINGLPTFNTTSDGTDQNLRGTAFMANDGISGSAWTIVPLEAGGTFDLFACSHGTTVNSSLATYYNGFTGEYISSL